MAKITLHGIGREIRRVRGALRKARAGAEVQHKKKLDAHIKKLQKLEASTQSICTKSWNLWPVASKK
jgi:hypothetical protein